MKIINWLDKIILLILKAVTITAFGLLTLIITATILSRYFPVISLLWSEEIITILFAYLIFYGSAALWITREHFTVGDWFERIFLHSAWAKHIYRLILELMVFIFVVVFFYFSLQLTLSTEAVTNVLAISKKVLYSCLPISGIIMIIYSLRNIIGEIANLFKTAQKDPAHLQG
jgi:TRAP-type C4-dicarboxylate transport system permease small subunit